MDHQVPKQILCSSCDISLYAATVNDFLPSKGIKNPRLVNANKVVLDDEIYSVTILLLSE